MKYSLSHEARRAHVIDSGNVLTFLVLSELLLVRLIVGFLLIALLTESDRRLHHNRGQKIKTFQFYLITYLFENWKVLNRHIKVDSLIK